MLAWIAESNSWLFPDDISDVTLLRPDVQERFAHRENVVNLAGMHDSDEVIPHHHHVQVGGRKGSGEFRERLIRKAQNVRHFLCPILHLRELTAAAYKAKNYVLVIGELLCGLQQRVQRMAWAMVPRIHHDKLL